MSSVLIAIGCNRYDHVPSLNCAESDASAVFEILTGKGQPYSPAESILLHSPTKGRLIEVIQQVAERGSLESLTLYFSGHGIWHKGAFYFALKDSRSDLLSMTAFALSEWIRVIKDLSPAQTHIVIDACNAAGSQSSITELLNDPDASKSFATSFSCLSASSAEQSAKEIDGFGVMTAALIKVLSGEQPTHSSQSHLSLIEIAREVSVLVPTGHDSQKITAWGLNLHGQGKFCRNPAQSSGEESLPSISRESPMRKQAEAHFEELWNLYREIPKGIDLSVLRDRMEKICMRSDITSEDRSVFVLGVANSFCERLGLIESKWDVAELAGSFAALLLPDVPKSPTAHSAAKELMNRKEELEFSAIAELVAEIEEAPYCLLANATYLADYYYLPQRITKLLAVIANAAFVAREQNRPHLEASARTLVSKILETYSATLRSVSDTQATPAFIWFMRASSLGWRDELEVTLGCLFNDLVQTAGRVARGSLNPETAFEYCLSRGRSPKEITKGHIATPSALIAILLLVGAGQNMDELIDGHLESMDHRDFNLYVPGEYARYWIRTMNDGINHTGRIGHDTWTCDDFRKRFAPVLKKHLQDAPLPLSELEQSMVIVASLCYPDRLPLFLCQ